MRGSNFFFATGTVKIWHDATQLATLALAMRVSSNLPKLKGLSKVGDRA